MMKNRAPQGPPNSSAPPAALDPTSTSEPAPPTGTTPTALELFVAFAKIALSGFGGVIAWARRVLVQDRGWLTPQEFAEVLALCQVLPGPNIVNMSIAVGGRFRGVPGSLAGFFGLMAVPFCLVLLFGVFYAHYGDEPAVHGAFAGVASAAAGLLTATAARMAVPILERRFRKAAPFLALAFVAVALFRVPLHWVIIVLAPLSVAASWTWRK